MATVQPTITEMPVGADCRNARLITWGPLTTTNADGAPVKLPGYADKTVHLRGTAGAGGNCRVEGSNVPAPSADADYTALTDPQGNALNMGTDGGLEQVTENPLWVRPRVTAGDGTTSLYVRLLVRRD